MTNETTKPTPDPQTPRPEMATRQARRMVKSSDLLGGDREVLIEHNGGVYSLRQTSNGKLILTK
jgi:hemin uptake protein HemP